MFILCYGHHDPSGEEIERSVSETLRIRLGDEGTEEVDEETKRHRWDRPQL